MIFYVPQAKLAQLKVGQNLVVGFIQADKNSTTTTTSATVSYVSDQAAYTPPLIYSNENAEKLTYRIEAVLAPNTPFHVGQPAQVVLP